MVFSLTNKMLSALENGTTTLVTYTRDDMGRRPGGFAARLLIGRACAAGRASYHNGASVSYTYANDNSLSTLTDSFVGASLAYTFAYNADKEVTSQTVSDTTYEWMPTSNVNATYTPNNLNQYSAVKVNLPTQAYTYDGNGNLTSDGANSYTYDAENKLIAASTTVPQAHSVTYQYDPLGRRFSKTVDGTVTQFLSDQAEQIAEYDGSGNLLRRYVVFVTPQAPGARLRSLGLGPAIDEPIVMIQYSGGTETGRSTYAMNAQGSVVALTTTAGAVSDKYVYDPYGGSTDSTTGNPIRFTGRYYDAETNLYYYRARYYSPVLGRFLQTDPIGYGDNLNMYMYAENDPVMYGDPLGLAPDVAGIISDGIDTIITTSTRLTWNAYLDELGVSVGEGAEALGSFLETIPLALIGSLSGDTPQKGTLLNNDKKGNKANNDKQKKGRPRTNGPQNKQVKQAAKEVGLDKDQTAKLGDAVEKESRHYGENPGYKDIVEIAKEIKSGEYY